MISVHDTELLSVSDINILPYEVNIVGFLYYNTYIFRATLSVSKVEESKQPQLFSMQLITVIIVY